MDLQVGLRLLCLHSTKPRFFASWPIKYEVDYLHRMINVKFKLDFGAFNVFLNNGDICRLLITFANSLDPGQEEQRVGSDLDRTHLTQWKCS